MPTDIQIIEADLADPLHAAAVAELVNSYAADPIGIGRSLPEEVLIRMVPGLRAHPASLVFLAYRGTEAVGVAVCFRGYSTFSAKPLINIHDLAVKPTCRNQGIGRLLLEHVAAKARDLGCCKVTLEVREDNLNAQHLYKSTGFSAGNGSTLFLTRPLP